MKSKSVRIKETTHEEILEFSALTDCTVANIIKVAWAEFKKSPKYARMVLFCDNKSGGNE